MQYCIVKVKLCRNLSILPTSVCVTGILNNSCVLRVILSLVESEQFVLNERNNISAGCLVLSSRESVLSEIRHVLDEVRLISR